jgi:hypothetical protein
MSAAAMALAASSASAGPIVVSGEGGALPATVHATTVGTTADLYQHTGTTEVLFSRCTNEFDAAITAGGAVTITPANVTLGGAQCGRAPCPGVNWTGQITEVAAGNERLAITFCLIPSGGGTPISCTVSIPIITTAAHDYELSTAGLPSGEAGCSNLGNIIELAGAWHLEGQPNTIEISH